MGLIGIAARAIVAYIVLLVLVRVSGRQSVRQGTTFQFAIALVIGDMVDNAIWAEVSLAKFLVAVATLFATHWAVEYANYRLDLAAHGGYGGHG
jgi:uncharacterized membrane protein YcaP (DUF421 family)